MVKLFYFLLFITALSTFKMITDKWKIYTYLYRSCPILFPYDTSYLKINTINNLTGETSFEVYYNNNYTKSQNCTVFNYTISCGILTNYYKCEPIGMFENLTSDFIQVTFDFNRLTIGSSLYSIPLFIFFNWNSSIEDNHSETCIIYGEKQNMMFPNDTYKVIECACPACCYKKGSQIQFKHIDDHRNKQMLSIEGVLEGEYCENTMSEVDFCEGYNFKWNYPAKNNFFNGSLLNCNQTNCNGKDLNWSINGNISNVIGDHVFLYWNLGDDCSLYARKDANMESILM